jgi:hypothetical protein
VFELKQAYFEKQLGFNLKVLHATVVCFQKGDYSHAIKVSFNQ